MFSAWEESLIIHNVLFLDSICIFPQHYSAKLNRTKQSLRAFCCAYCILCTYMIWYGFFAVILFSPIVRRYLLHLRSMIVFSFWRGKGFTIFETYSRWRKSWLSRSGELVNVWKCKFHCSLIENMPCSHKIIWYSLWCSCTKSNGSTAIWSRFKLNAFPAGLRAILELYHQHRRRCRHCLWHPYHHWWWW